MMKIFSILLQLLSVYAVIWGFSQLRENHRDFQQLSEEYKKLISVYENRYASGVDDKVISEIKNSIKWKEDPNHYSGVEQSIDKYFLIIILGLVGISVKEVLDKRTKKRKSIESESSERSQNDNVV